ncbi:hypothetical protein BEL04_21485 [Mucilaginibacter sp. PPCGB 2223]|uniref:DUF2252 domain-containing protein n=1 Tax=Mucilaginibacter sp. PPCGB 2223 TaxID=1886027 RepID=UPI0008244CAA|nr:DUF2252 family protein [Mucilaginibacter sp. PPCGB 2223]OCX50363.1 hypothetical protein BEL04_21485 [Mucilaginibacter sp. PPCGB 2223]
MRKISQRLISFNAPLLPGMVRLKYEAMTENAFRFYRGTCHIFYEDLSQAHKALPPSPLTWISGDLHIENYGSYKGDNRLVYFDLNDFDESLLAPAAWEIVRMLTSIFVAFESLKIDKAEALRMVQLFLRSYSDRLKKGKAISLEPRTAKGIVCTFLEKAENRKLKELLEKRTEIRKNKLVLSLNHKRHFAVDKKLRAELLHHITEWIANSSDGPYNFKAIDVVFRLAGTGSVGVKRYMFLLRSAKEKKKYLLIDMKQARPSSVSPYVDAPQPGWETEAERILAIEQRMQDILPALISVTSFRGDSYVIQEMQPTEDRIDFDLIKERYRDIYQVVDDMAALTASAHLRSSGRQGSAIADDLIAFGEDTHWHDQLIAYAKKYTKQVKKDYKDFVADYKKGVFGK